MRWSWLALLIFHWILSPWAQAQDETSRLRHLIEDVDLRMRLMNSAIQTNQRLELSFENLEKRSLSPDDFDRQWTREFQEITQDYIENQLRLGGFDTRELGPIRKMFSHLHWGELSGLYSKTWRKMRFFARTHGTNLLAVLIVTNIIQLILPFFMTMIGHPLVALILLKIPTTVPTIYIHQAISNVLFEARMSRLMGGREAFNKLKELDKQVLQELKLSAPTDLFSPLPQQSNEVLLVKKTRMLQSLMQQFGLSQDHLNLRTMRGFLREQGLADPVLWGLHNDPRLSEKLKLTMMIHHISTQADGEVLTKFKLRFGESFRSLAPNFQGSHALLEWSSGILASKSPQDLSRALTQNIPGLEGRHYLNAWEQVILPELARGEQLSYNEIRQLVTRYHALKIQMEIAPSEWSGQQALQELSQYFHTSLNTGWRACFRTQQEIIRGLIP